MRLLCIATIGLFWIVVQSSRADVTTFEDLNVPPSGYENGSNLAGSFSTNGHIFNNSYENTFGSWSGWAYSNQTDSTTAGFGNQYSSIVGGGASGSSNFGIGYQNFVDPDPTITFNSTVALESIAITNTTYAYFSMRDGDTYAKKFGGVTGNDSDFFLLTIEGIKSGVAVGSVDFYLADYRFTDNAQDYIVNSWHNVSLTSLGLVDSLRFSLSSSDVGAFGVNTPTYFAADNIITSGVPEPMSLALLTATGAFGMIASRYRNRQRLAQSAER